MNKAESYRATAAKLRQGWTQDAYARHKNGNSIGPNEPNAVCWNATVAFHSVNPNPLIEEELLMRKDFAKAAEALFAPCDYPRPVPFNDTFATSGEQVARVYDQMALDAEGAE